MPSHLLPVEIIESVLTEAWNLHLSAEERINLMTSLPLVNQTWLEVYNRVSMKDVHIPCPSYSDYFFRILREDCPLFSEETMGMPNIQCRSITFHVENTTIHPPPAPEEEFEDTLPMGQTLGNTLYTIHTLSYLPNLRCVAIDYLNCDYNDIADQYRLIAFPSQVTDLAISYDFSSRTPSWLLRSMKDKIERVDCLNWNLPNVKSVTITGAGDNLVGNLLSTCWNAKTLTTDDSADVEALAPFPDFMHTVLLCSSSGNVTRVEV